MSTLSRDQSVQPRIRGPHSGALCTLVRARPRASTCGQSTCVLLAFTRLRSRPGGPRTPCLMAHQIRAHRTRGKGRDVTRATYSLSNVLQCFESIMYVHICLYIMRRSLMSPDASGRCGGGRGRTTDRWKRSIPLTPPLDSGSRARRAASSPYHADAHTLDRGGASPTRKLAPH